MQNRWIWDVTNYFLFSYTLSFPFYPCQPAPALRGDAFFCAASLLWFHMWIIRATWSYSFGTKPLFKRSAGRSKQEPCCVLYSNESLFKNLDGQTKKAWSSLDEKKINKRNFSLLFALWCWWLWRRYSTAQLCSRLLSDHKGPAEYCNAHLTCSDVLYVRPLFPLNCSFFIVFNISQTCSLVKGSELKVGPEMIVICTLFMTLLSETEGWFFITWKHKLTSKKSFVSLLSRQKRPCRTTKQLRNPEQQKAHMYSVWHTHP